MNKLTATYKIPERNLSYGEVMERKRKKEAAAQAMVNSSRAKKTGKWKLFNRFLGK